MPVISMFYGIIVALYFFDTGKHNRPHFTSNIRVKKRLSAFLTVISSKVASRKAE